MARRPDWLAPDQDPVRTELLREMVRESERVIDGQLKAIEELDDKGEAAIRVAVLALVFGFSMGAFVVQTNETPWILRFWTIMVVGTGIILNLVALALIVHSYSSLSGRRDAQTTPDITALPKRHKTPLMDLEIHFEGLIEGYGNAQKANHAHMETVTKWRRIGLRTLLWTTFLPYFGGLILIAVRALIK